MVEEYGYPLLGGQDVEGGHGAGGRPMNRRRRCEWGALLAFLTVVVGCSPVTEAPPPPTEALLQLLDPSSVEVVPSGDAGRALGE